VSIVRSLSGVLAERLPGFADALGATPKEVLDSTADKDAFERFLSEPLARMTAPAAPVVIVLDALDEIPTAKLPAVLRLLRGAMLKLPVWVRFFVTSREDLQIKDALSQFKPTELLVDEARNLQDLRSFFRVVARKLGFDNRFSVEDLVTEVQSKFDVDIGPRVEDVTKAVQSSKALYGDAIAIIKQKDPKGYEELLRVQDIRPTDLVQHTDDLEKLYASYPLICLQHHP
jgi:hypothetical protein